MVVRKCCSFHHIVPVPDPNHCLLYQHGHLDYPPAEGKFFELPAGGTAISQLACNLGATKWWADSEGSTDLREDDYPCPGYPISQFHVSFFRTLIGVMVADLSPLGVTEYVLPCLPFLPSLT